MNEEQLKEKIKKIESELYAKRKEYNKVGNQITRIINKLKPLQEELDEIQCDKNDIGYLLEAFPETNIKRKMLNELASQYCLDVSGFRISNNQSALRIKLTLDDDEITKKTYEGILKFLPYMKPIKLEGRQYQKNKVICFDIMESTLSEHDNYLFIIDKESMKAAVSSYYEKPKWKSIPETLRIIQKEYYYMKTVNDYP